MRALFLGALVLGGVLATLAMGCAAPDEADDLAEAALVAIAQGDYEAATLITTSADCHGEVPFLSVLTLGGSHVATLTDASGHLTSARWDATATGFKLSSIEGASGWVAADAQFTTMGKDNYQATLTWTTADGLRCVIPTTATLML